MAGGELVEGGLLEHVQRHVDELHVAGLGHVRGEADAVAPVERAVLDRDIGQRHEVVDVHRHVLLVELQRGDADLADLRALVLAGLRLAGLVLVAIIAALAVLGVGLGAGLVRALARVAALAVLGLVLVAGLAVLVALAGLAVAFVGLVVIVVLGAREEVELLRRLAQRHGADAVHGAHVPVLQRAQLVLGRPRGMATAQLRRELAQLGVEVLLEIVGIAGVLGLRVGALGRQAVLVHQRGEHLPPAAVVGRAVVDDLEDARVGRLVERGQHVLQIGVRLLHRVPEEEVGLGEFEVLEVPAVHQLVAQGVQGSEHPAAAGALLIGDRPLLELDGEIARQRAHAAVVGGGLEHAGRYGRVRGDQIGPIRIEIVAVCAQQFGFDGPCAGIRCHDAPICRCCRWHAAGRPGPFLGAEPPDDHADSRRQSIGHNCIHWYGTFFVRFPEALRVPFSLI